MQTTCFTVNGTRHAVQADAKTPLLDVLRDEFGLKGTRFGCGAGECGARAHCGGDRQRVVRCPAAAGARVAADG